jgi:hypothetical protein
MSRHIHNHVVYFLLLQPSCQPFYTRASYSLFFPSPTCSGYMLTSFVSGTAELFSYPWTLGHLSYWTLFSAQAREADRRAKEAGSGFMYFIAEAKTTTAEQTLRSGPSIVTMKTSRPLRGAPRSRQGTSDGSELSDSHHHPESPVSPEKTQPHARRGSVPPLRGSDFSSTSSRQNAFHLVAETPSSANDLGINSRRGVKSSNIANSPKPTRDASERTVIATERERRGSMIELGSGASSAKRDAEHVRAVTTGSPMMSREDRISQLLKEADMFEQASERSRAKTSGIAPPLLFFPHNIHSPTTA